MTRRYKEARLLNNLKVVEAIEKLGISQPTLNAWEGERKTPSLDALENMADLYGVTTDYLLTGRPAQPGEAEALSRMVASLVDLADVRLEQRQDRPFTRQELALLFTAMLTEA